MKIEIQSGVNNVDWETIKQLWPGLKDLFQSAAILFSAVTLGFAVFRLPRIVSDLKEGGNEINEKLQSTLKQLTELQRIVADERPAEEIASGNNYVRSNSDDSEKNWERIKQYWRISEITLKRSSEK
jgi:hypothetical protein